MQIIRSGVDGIKVQLWEAITRYRARISENGLRGRIEMGFLLRNPFCVKRWHPSFNCINHAKLALLIDLYVNVFRPLTYH